MKNGFSRCELNSAKKVGLFRMQLQVTEIVNPSS